MFLSANCMFCVLVYICQVQVGITGTRNRITFIVIFLLRKFRRKSEKAGVLTLSSSNTASVYSGTEIHKDLCHPPNLLLYLSTVPEKIGKSWSVDPIL